MPGPFDTMLVYATATSRLRLPAEQDCPEWVAILANAMRYVNTIAPPFHAHLATVQGYDEQVTGGLLTAITLLREAQQSEALALLAPLSQLLTAAPTPTALLSAIDDYRSRVSADPRNYEPVIQKVCQALRARPAHTPSERQAIEKACRAVRIQVWSLRGENQAAVSAAVTLRQSVERVGTEIAGVAGGLQAVTQANAGDVSAQVQNLQDRWLAMQQYVAALLGIASDPLPPGKLVALKAGNGAWLNAAAPGAVNLTGMPTLPVSGRWLVEAASVGQTHGLALRCPAAGGQQYLATNTAQGTVFLLAAVSLSTLWLSKPAGLHRVRLCTSDQAGFLHAATDNAVKTTSSGGTLLDPDDVWIVEPAPALATPENASGTLATEKPAYDDMLHYAQEISGITLEGEETHAAEWEAIVANGMSYVNGLGPALRAYLMALQTIDGEISSLLRSLAELLRTGSSAVSASVTLLDQVLHAAPAGEPLAANVATYRSRLQVDGGNMRAALENVIVTLRAREHGLDPISAARVENEIFQAGFAASVARHQNELACNASLVAEQLVTRLVTDLSTMTSHLQALNSAGGEFAANSVVALLTAWQALQNNIKSELEVLAQPYPRSPS